MYQLITDNQVQLIENAQQAKDAIIKANGLGVKSLYMVATVLQQVNAYRIYKEDGAKNIAEWAGKNFGYKKSQVHNMLNAARWLKNGETILPHGDRDFNLSQIVEIQRLGDKKALSMVQNGDIAPEMTVANIKKIVDNVVNVKTTAEVVENEEADKETASNEVEAKTDKKIASTDKKTDINAFISDIMKKYGDKAILFDVKVDGVDEKITFIYTPKEKVNK